MLKRLVKRVFPRLPAIRAAAAREWQAALAVGATAAARLWVARQIEAGRTTGRLSRLNLAGYRFPLCFRPGGSDPWVIGQVFVRQEYAAVAGLPGVEFIIDCGANIGCTTFYLLHRYPTARAVVVEPDANNMALCRRNLAPFGDRVTFVEAGVWSSAGPLVVERAGFRDGAEWAYRVRPAAQAETPDVTAVTVCDLLELGGFPRVDLLKIDIEGAEVEVFAPGSERWLQRTRNIAVEVHGPDCERAVLASLAGFRYQRETSGELAVFRDILPNVACPTG